MQTTDVTRRSFLATGGAAVGAAALTDANLADANPAETNPAETNLVETGPANTPPGARVRIYIFSKHLQWLDYEDCARTAVDIGYDGIEVTLRRNGHIEPERVEEDLPRFMAACRKHGIPCDAAVTNITDPDNRLDRRVLEAMQQAGITHYRLNGWHYEDAKGTLERLNEIKPAVRNIVQASRDLGLIAVFQNHSGAQYVGSTVWDIHELIRDVDTNAIGYSFDIGHATIEGGYSWVNDAKLALPLAKSLVVKDFTWIKTEDRGWRSEWCHLGTGMMDAERYFALVARSAYRGTISMHFEYVTPGNTHVNWYRNHINDQKRDIATLRRWLRRANLA